MLVMWHGLSVCVSSPRMPPRSQCYRRPKALTLEAARRAASASSGPTARAQCTCARGVPICARAQPDRDEVTSVFGLRYVLQGPRQKREEKPPKAASDTQHACLGSRRKAASEKKLPLEVVHNGFSKRSLLCGAVQSGFRKQKGSPAMPS